MASKAHKLMTSLSFGEGGGETKGDDFATESLPEIGGGLARQAEGPKEDGAEARPHGLCTCTRSSP
eukprot:CAMPEP_0185281660 /NCGR_PEP_ID=MMETSP1359-20130426/66841_1 /TAXON_ID=552665 /ORGANISM="Bigelowiella longifila, Strain CCMP242" /LENGTH=65 /DNA_ID=CAMNT_0027877115 /DNA_START=1080 /DNA_END=1274 /DNA_ORIENTATION=+